MENSAVTVGSYIAYSGGDYSGLWVVLRNNGGQLEIISKDSVGLLTLSGADDYANVVKILNDKCATYVNSTYATAGRSVGATSSSIGQINTTDNPITYEAARTETLPYKDEYYTTDQSIIANPSNSTLKHGTANTYNNDGYVWLASRYLSAGISNSSFYVRYLDTGGSMRNGSLFKAYSGNETGSNSYSRGVRPVITLKSNIKIIDGAGTSGSPYVLGI